MRSEVMEQGDPLYTANVQLLSDRDLSRMRMTKSGEIGASTIYGSLAMWLQRVLGGEKVGWNGSRCAFQWIFFCTKEMCMSRMVVVWALLLIIFIRRPLGVCDVVQIFCKLAVLVVVDVMIFKKETPP